MKSLRYFLLLQLLSGVLVSNGVSIWREYPTPEELKKRVDDELRRNPCLEEYRKSLMMRKTQTKEEKMAISKENHRRDFPGQYIDLSYFNQIIK